MKKIGVYAGSFNPFHVGHADILHQASELFDEVIVAVGRNPDKDANEKEPFPVRNPILGKANVMHYGGMISDFLDSLEINSEDKVFLIRGLRNGEDLQYEQNQIQFIKEMYPSLRTVFFICDKKFEHVSSKSLRALKKFSEKEFEKYVFTPKPRQERPKFGSSVQAEFGWVCGTEV